MSEGFVFSVSAMGGLFVLLLLALLRAGVDGVLKLWPVIGPLLGGLVGTVTTAYFADARVESVRAESANQLALVATNVAGAIERLQRDNAALRASGAPPVPYVTGGGAQPLITTPFAPFYGGEEPD